MNSSFWSRFSLRQKISGMVLACMAIVSITTFGMFRHVSQVAEREKLATFGTHAAGLSERISAQFYERYGDVQAFAINEAFRGNDVALMTETLNQYAKIYSIYDLILFVDVSGNYIASNTKAPDGSPIEVGKIQGLSFSEEPWFKSAMSGQFTEDAKKGLTGTYFEDAQIDKTVSMVYGRPMFGNAFSGVVTSVSGKVLGVMTARPGFRWVEGEVVGLYRQLLREGLGTSEITLLNRSGQVLIDYDPTLNGGELAVKRDFDNVIGKLNLAERGVEAAKAVVAGKSGTQFALHARKNLIQAAGYASIKTDKFIDSIGWGVLVRTSRDELIADLAKAEFVFLAALALCVALACTLALLFSTRLGSTLTQFVDTLTRQGVDLTSASNQVASASTELSASATEQAAALQETVASLDEISAMINKNADNAKRSQDASATGRQAASLGKQAVNEMQDSIEEISRSNTDIMQQIETSNQEIANIVKIISEIGNKTKVINDIVFQTKLLSFNASVEAARAGEHGKGFAVVAEEVGNLAQMSGNAAKEISQMLDESVRHVEKTVVDTKMKVERLMASGKEKIESGVVMSRRCGEALDEMVKNVDYLGQMVGEIAIASNEQAQGVQEITRAMAQLDQVTQQNASASEQAASAAAQLNDQAEGLRGIVKDLAVTVQGGVRRGGARINSINKKNAQRGKTMERNEEAREPVGKATVGADELPSENDPRFEDS